MVLLKELLQKVDFEKFHYKKILSYKVAGRNTVSK